MAKQCVAIVTTHGDAHAYLVCDRIRHDKGMACHVFDIDMTSADRPISVMIDNTGGNATYSDHFGQSKCLSDFSVCWWRRFPPNIAAIKEETDRLFRLRSAAVFQSFVGGFLTHFQGRNISCPFQTIRAENKLLQLSVAKQTGLRVPKTLISNKMTAITEFFAINGPACIVKTIAQPARGMIDASLVTRDHLDLDDAIRLPTIFQEFIQGETHLMILMMRDRLLTFAFEAEDVDWRRNVPDRFQLIDLEEPTVNRLRALQRSLGLSMAIVDMKRDRDGEYVFLELNPQGQFLFMEPLSSVPITDLFAEFLLAEASAAGPS